MCERAGVLFQAGGWKRSRVQGEGRWAEGEKTVGRKKQKRRSIYNEPVEGGKPAGSRSSGAGGPRLQLPAFTSGDSVWTSAAQFSLSPSFMYVKSAACNKKSNSEGTTRANGGVSEVLYEQITDSSREAVVNVSPFEPIKTPFGQYVWILTYVM